MSNGKETFFKQPPYDIEVYDSKGIPVAEFRENQDGTWMGPLEDQDNMTLEEVLQYIATAVKKRGN